jgi:hypothetical protein
MIVVTSTPRVRCATLGYAIEPRRGNGKDRDAIPLQMTISAIASVLESDRRDSSFHTKAP